MIRNDWTFREDDGPTKKQARPPPSALPILANNAVDQRRLPTAACPACEGRPSATSEADDPGVASVYTAASLRIYPLAGDSATVVHMKCRTGSKLGLIPAWCRPAVEF